MINRPNFETLIITVKLVSLNNCTSLLALIMYVLCRWPQAVRQPVEWLFKSYSQVNTHTLNSFAKLIMYYFCGSYLEYITWHSCRSFQLKCFKWRLYCVDFVICCIFLFLQSYKIAMCMCLYACLYFVGYDTYIRRPMCVGDVYFIVVSHYRSQWPSG